MSDTLAERLGYDASTKLVIISCDDLGSCHAANIGVYSAIRHGIATCASVMVPAPWARHAATMYAGEDIGVHITLNAEHPLYRWGPITHAPSLLSGDGGFPRNVDDLWEHADPAEVLRECRAQIEGVVFPDHFDHDWRAGSRDRVYSAIRNLQPGVTEIHIQPSIDTPEVRALTDSASEWIDDLDLALNDSTVRELLDDSGAVLIGYRELRDAMRRD